MITWDELERVAKGCHRCRLCEGRHSVVVGVGNREADVMLVGEGPGYNEDMQGEPFVGAAGQLLDKMLAAIDLSREDVYIANVVKCRPPGNRDPLPEEQRACLDYLRCQYMLIKPKIIVCLGRIAAKAMITPDFLISKNRGRWYYKKGVWFMATFHPSALLRDESKKKYAWEDMQSLRDKIKEVCNEQ